MSDHRPVYCGGNMHGNCLHGHVLQAMVTLLRLPEVQSDDLAGPKDGLCGNGVLAMLEGAAEKPHEGGCLALV